MARISLAVRVVAALVVSLAEAMHVRKVEAGDGPSASMCDKVDNRCCRKTHPPNVTTGSEASSDLAPMIIWTHGCGGSSAAMVIAHDLAELGDRPVLNCGGGYELLADISKGYYGQSSDFMGLFRGFVKRASDSKRSLLFKGETRYAQGEKELMPYLSSLNAKVVTMRRWNVLDVALCAVHDCFTNWMPSEFGYALDSEGRRSTNCDFRGRAVPGNETKTELEKVHVNAGQLLTNLHQITHDQDESDNFVRDKGFSVDSFETSEDLFAFEMGGQGLRTSTIAWQSFMRKLGVRLAQPVIRAYLREFVGAHEAPRGHASMIENMEAVKQAINECDLPEDQLRDGKEFRTAQWCAKLRAMLRA